MNSHLPLLVGDDLKTVMETGWSLSSSSSVRKEDGLSLELGRGSGVSAHDHHRKKRSVFHGLTVNQLHELQLQAFIFKYIEADLPVPHQLLIPICQSFSNSLAAYPTCSGINPVYMDSRKGIEQEPWRCRRTDGKKWRCAKEVLPHQKYCERHVHRGRHRPRKLADGAPKTSILTASDMTDLSI